MIPGRIWRVEEPSIVAGPIKLTCVPLSTVKVEPVRTERAPVT